MEQYKARRHRTRGTRILAMLGLAGLATSVAATPIVSLGSLDGSNGFRLVGAAGESEGTGSAVSAAGDVNGDGIGDLIIGARSADGAIEDAVGGAYVVFGRTTPFPATFALQGLNGTDGFRVEGEVPLGQLGGAAPAGDFNADGVDDLLIFRGSGDASERAYVVFGRSTPFPATLSLASLDGTNGLQLFGSSLGLDSSAAMADGAGDVNGDGVDDVVIGIPGAGHTSTTRRAGSSFVVFGRRTPFPSMIDVSALNGSDGFRLDGSAFGDQAGSAVAGAGDVNGDGLDDVLICAQGVNTPGIGADTGAAYLIFGRSTPFPAVTALASLDGTSGFRINGQTAGDYLSSVNAAGDVNGDGVGDIVLGASLHDLGSLLGAGAAYVVFGKRTPFVASMNVSTLDGTTGFRLRGNAFNDYLGSAVAGIDDVNDDGFDDVLVGAPHSDVGVTENAGKSYVVFGGAAPFPATLEVANLDGRNGFRLDGVDVGDYSGEAVNPAGDLNGDGVADFVIGADQAESATGSSYVVFGRSDRLMRDGFELE